MTGSILGPLLFLLYKSDLPKCLDSTIPCLHADDTQVLATSPDPLELIDKLNGDFVNISKWLSLNKLQYHPSEKKNQCLLVHPDNIKNKINDTQLLSSV